MAGSLGRTRRAMWISVQREDCARVNSCLPVFLIIFDIDADGCYVHFHFVACIMTQNL